MNKYENVQLSRIQDDSLNMTQCLWMNRKSFFAIIWVICVGKFSIPWSIPMDSIYFSFANFPKWVAIGAVCQQVLKIQLPDWPWHLQRFFDDWSAKFLPTRPLWSSTWPIIFLLLVIDGIEVNCSTNWATLIGSHGPIEPIWQSFAEAEISWPEDNPWRYPDSADGHLRSPVSLGSLETALGQADPSSCWQDANQSLTPDLMETEYSGGCWQSRFWPRVKLVDVQISSFCLVISFPLF